MKEFDVHYTAKVNNFITVEAETKEEAQEKALDIVEQELSSKYGQRDEYDLSVTDILELGKDI